MKILYFLLILLLFSISLLSQNQIQYKPSEKIMFEHITEDDGLSNNNVTCILQDSKGYIWFGTQKGLNRYDGNKFVIFKHDPNNISSLAQNYITEIFEDRNGTIWIGTRTKNTKGKVKGGLEKFIREKEQFIHYSHDPSKPFSLSNNYINSICEDDSGMIWIATMNGLNKFDKQKEEFIQYNISPDIDLLSFDVRISSLLVSPFRDKKSILIATLGEGLKILNINNNKINDFISKETNKYSNITSHVKSIYEDRHGIIWFGTEYGLFKFNHQNNELIRYVNNPDQLLSISNDRIRTIYEDKSGTIWIGTLNGGLNKFNRNSDTFTRYIHDPNIPHSLSNNHVKTIYEDKSGVIWVGTRDGVNKFFKQQNPFIHYKYNSENRNSLSDNRIWSVLEDKIGNIWIGTSKGLNKFDPISGQFLDLENNIRTNLMKDRIWSIYEDNTDVIWFGTNNGLVKLNNKTKKIKHYKKEQNNHFGLISDNINKIFKDKTGVLWIGTRNGLIRFDHSNDRFFSYKHDPKNPNSLSKNYILSIFDSSIDGKNVLWIGTQMGGLNKLDPETEKFYHYFNDPKDETSLSNNTVWKIYKDKKNELWIVTRKGLNRYINESDNFKRYDFSFDDNNKIDICKSIIEDKSGNLWIGNNFGLFKYDRNNDKFVHYNEKYNIWLESVDAIVADENGNLWLSNDDLITKFNPESMHVKNFKIDEGINNKQQILHPNLKFRNGKILVSGLNGFILFDPSSIKDNSSIPNIAITDFKIFNKSVEIKYNEFPSSENIVYLEKSISETNEIEIPYDKDVFSIEFSALDFREPSKNKYAYKLDGVDPDWIYTDATRRFATYNQLNPGEYIFHVKGTNNDCVWNEEGKTLKIIITPLWWQTFWFKIFVIGLIIGIIALIFYKRIDVLKKKHQLQEEFTRQLINSQEMDRKRIASALHDSHGQNLLVINNEVQSFIKDHTQYEQDFKPVSEIIHESINEIRTISYDLHPHQLDKLGLVKTIKSMVNKISGASEIKFILQIDNIDDIFDKKIEINIYRIIQEATNNIIKHSNATEAEIDISKKFEFVNIIISDKGIGLGKAKEITNTLGQGLSGMKERATLIKAEFSIDSEAGNGTEIKISIPYKF